MATNSNICTNYSRTDDSKFGEPLPWVGLYVTAASLACLLLMIADLFRSLKWRKVWIASKFFGFNAVTLTLLAIATKLSSDVTEAMPGPVDQLSKLSGIILLCVAMIHAMPSLGAMDGLAATSNMIALAIMVVSLFVNIRFQLNTGVISDGDEIPVLLVYYTYQFFSIYMLLLLLGLLSHSLSVSASRMILYRQYDKLHEQISKEVKSASDDNARFSNGKLEEYISKYWLMSLTSSPDYALRTSELSYILTLMNDFSFGYCFSLLSVLLEENEPNCNFIRSNYKWSAWSILFVQVLAIVIGSVSVYLRRSSSKPWSQVFVNLFKIEKYRYQLLLDLKDRPLPAWINNKRKRQVICKLRGMFLQVLIVLHFLVLILSRIVATLLLLISLIFGLLQLGIHKIWQICCCSTKPGDDTTTESSTINMTEYVLYLEDERDDEESKKIVEKWQKYPEKWIGHGESKKPTNLDSLLRKYHLSDAFRTVSEFYSKQISALDMYKTAPNCWALPIVTLASILYATTSSPDDRERLMLAVSEGLRYVRLVDENMDYRGTEGMQKAAKTDWDKLYLNGRWMNVDLDQMSRLSPMTFSEQVNELRMEAQKSIQEHCHNKEYFPVSNFSANCMYTTTEIILDRNRGGVPNQLFWSAERLEKVLTGLLGACLTNLRSAIFKHCSSGTFGQREEKVRDAATILGETRSILTFLEENPDLELNFPQKKEYFESWSCERSSVLESYA